MVELKKPPAIKSQPEDGEVENLDIAVIGAGLTGLLVTTILVTQYGISPEKIGLFEQWPGRYSLPRACGFADDNARIYFSCLPRKEAQATTRRILTPDFTWRWIDRHGQELYKADWNKRGPSGYDVIQEFIQPDMERVMEDTITKRDPRILRFNHELAHLQQNEDKTVSLEFVVRNKLEEPANPGQRKRVRARFVIGADSANSAVRTLSGIGFDDYGFSYDWLVVDAKPNQELLDWANAKLGYFQACDPKRPATIVWGGPGRRRFEFMRMPGESKEELMSKTWELLKPYRLTPSNTVIERKVVYTFRARIVDTFRKGSCIVAGDAAHLTPPFLGQGAQMGIRDAINLAWRLDLVLRDPTLDHLLTNFSSERRAPCKFLIDLAVKVGEIICVTTEEEADERHEAFRKQDAEQTGDASLGSPGEYSAHPAAGKLSLHREVIADDGKAHLLDEVLGHPRWRLLSWNVSPLDPSAGISLSNRSKEVIDLLKMESYTITTQTDATGDWRNWFEKELQADVVLVRPDFYVGHVGKSTQIDKLLCEYYEIITASTGASLQRSGSERLA